MSQRGESGSTGKWHSEVKMNECEKTWITVENPKSETMQEKRSP